MSDSRIVVDVGNTTIAYGLASNEDVTSPSRIATNSVIDASDFVAHITKLIHDNNAQPDQIVACVGVAHLQTALVEAAADMRLTLHLINGTNAGGVTINYETPETLGPDRVANAIAASYLVPLPGLVIDCGTAINIDYINVQGAFCGGAILPGIETARNSLTQHAPNLPKVDLVIPQGLFGTNTVTCIQSGVLNGAASAIDSFIYKARKYHDIENVILTGGNASILLPLLNEEVIFNEWFTLGGLALAKVDE